MMELKGQKSRQKDCPHNSLTSFDCTGSQRKSSRFWFWGTIVLLASAAPISAQQPSPLELARGIRESGMPDLALEYLKEIENVPLSEDDKKGILLERAK